MTGYSREGLLGEHASILFDREDVTAATALIRSLLETESHTETIELPLETKAGERIPCEAQIAVPVPDGEFLGSVGVLRDITERKRSERKLRERNERLDTFARIVSHDLRNPLGVAQGYLELFEETGDVEHAEKTRDGLDRMGSIIEDAGHRPRGRLGRRHRPHRSRVDRSRSVGPRLDRGGDAVSHGHDDDRGRPLATPAAPRELFQEQYRTQ